MHLMLFMIVSCSITSFRDKSINKWQRMTQVTTGAAAIKGKFHAFNQVRFFNWYWEFSYVIGEYLILILLPHHTGY